MLDEAKPLPLPECAIICVSLFRVRRRQSNHQAIFDLSGLPNRLQIASTFLILPSSILWYWRIAASLNALPKIIASNLRSTVKGGFFHSEVARSPADLAHIHISIS